VAGAEVGAVGGGLAAGAIIGALASAPCYGTTVPITYYASAYYGDYGFYGGYWPYRRYGYLKLERYWLTFARSYEFSERLDRFQH
jgi:hypothetical protein